MDDTQLYTIILRHDTSTQWMIVDPILSLGEYGVEDDTHRIKRGDGIHTWSQLPYDHFGFEYAITFENLQGDITDNEQLMEQFKKTLSKEDFKDNDGKILLDVNINQADDTIARLSKVNKNLETNKLENTVLVDIVSDDDSINGLWSVNKQGVSVLNLTSKTVIKDFDSNSSYNVNDVCIYNDTLYRAIKDIQPKDFDTQDWKSLSSTVAHNIEFDNSESHITANTVQQAIVELDSKLNEVEQKQNDSELQII